jgi:hypothetical protein
MKNSSFFSLNARDWFKGLVVAIITAVITLVYNTIQLGALSFDWKAIGFAAISAALAYILKNFITNSNDEILKREPEN